ncbi:MULTISPECIES: O-antigen ligase family protein [Streptomycetaceae]|uniref:O-antigen ligase family protein n=1 Tax=Streptomycetaceae TaxID=2062 RepID=UPI00300A07B7
MDTTTGGAPPHGGRTGRATGPRPGGRPLRQARQERRPSASGVDAAGMAVLACCAVWAVVCAGGRAARPEGALLALLAVTAGYAAGRVLGAMLPKLTLAAGAVTVPALVLVPAGRLSRGGSAPPLGYANADAALLVLAAGAACCAAWGVTGPLWRLPAVVWRSLLRLLALTCALSALLLGSSAAFAAGVAVVLCSLAAARMRHRLTGLAGLALAAALAVGGSYATAVDALPGGLSQSLTGQLTQPRVALWHEAVKLAERHPLRGVGPGRFAEESTPLPSDTPTAQTPQSAPFQLAAEQGVPGVVLLGGAYLWTLCALWRSPRSTPAVLTAAAALTGLGLLATVDHVLSYAAVTSAAGLLAGVATSRPWPAPAG